MSRRSRSRRTLAWLTGSWVVLTAIAVLAACGAGTNGTPDAGAGGRDAQAGDVRTPRDGAGRHDSSGDARPSGDSGDGATGDADAGCKTFDGGPFVALSWNEGCSSAVTNFLVEWGTRDGGPYPNVADAGDPCDAAGCVAGDAGQLSCHYDLRGLEAGSYCVVTVACDQGMCSTPSGQACVTVPEPCP
jgi:hypothetical protein